MNGAWCVCSVWMLCAAVVQTQQIPSWKWISANVSPRPMMRCALWRLVCERVCGRLISITYIVRNASSWHCHSLLANHEHFMAHYKFYIFFLLFTLLARTMRDHTAVHRVAKRQITESRWNEVSAFHSLGTDFSFVFFLRFSAKFNVSKIFKTIQARLWFVVPRRRNNLSSYLIRTCAGVSECHSFCNVTVRQSHTPTTAKR